MYQQGADIFLDITFYLLCPRQKLAEFFFVFRTLEIVSEKFMVPVWEVLLNTASNDIKI